MTSESNPGETKDPVQIALDEYRDSWMEGNRLDPDVFCRSHPEYGEELRKKIKDFLFVVERVPHSEPLDEEEKSGSTEENEFDSSRKLGDFRIIREIGRGGMGTVYEAEQISLRRKVALKILPTHMRFSRQAVLKFRREAEAGGRQRHPGIVAVYAVGEHRGVHYIAQELHEGGRTLADWLEEIQELEQPKGYFRDMARLISEVADALQHAHDSGVIHRDVKPPNILMTPEGSPKVTDFGLAKVENALALSRSGDFSGTPYYMSPEQVSLRHLNIDHRTDIFSLGVTLYEALTFVKPFEGEHSHEVLKKILIHEPKDPRKVNPRIPHDLAVICLKAMEKDPDRRYKSMADFAADLRRFLSGEVIEATPSGPGTRAWKWVKRHPVVSVPAAVALVAVITFMAYVIFWSYPEIKAEKARADAEAEKAREEAATSKAVLDFLTGLFESSDPKNAKGYDVTVRETLDQGVRRIRTSFGGQPVMKARLLSTMGRVYRELGRFDQAETLLEEALSLQQANVEKPGIEVFSAQHELALLRLHQGRLKEAESLMLEALESMRETLGEDHPTTLAAEVLLSQVYTEQGRYEEAEPLAREALEGLRVHSGEDNRDSLGALNQLAYLHYLQGRFHEAERAYLEILEGCRRIFGEDDPNTLSMVNHLVVNEMAQGKFREANARLLEAMDRFRHVLGEDHPDTLITLTNLATTFEEMKQYDQAIVHYGKALDGLRRVLGEEHPMTLTAINGLGTCCIYQGRIEEADPLLMEALAGFRRAKGDDHPDTLGIMGNLAYLRKMQGRFEEAESWMKASLERYSERLGHDHPDTLHTMVILAGLYEMMRRDDEAESLYRKGLEGYDRSGNGDHPMVFKVKSLLGSFYLKKGQGEKAESCYEEALEGQRRILGDDHSDTLNTMGNLGSLYTHKRSYKEAEKLCLEALDGFRKALGQDHPSTQVALYNLVIVYKKWGRYEEAEKAAQELLECTPEDTSDFREHAALLDEIREAANKSREEGDGS